MKYYKTLETKAKHIEYYLDHKCNQDNLKKIIENSGYNFSDFNIINTRGYDMKQVLRLKKSKIKKDIVLLEQLKVFFITEKIYNSLKINEKMYYPNLENITPELILS